ncbi:hypothetical protein E2C01_069802 [Portunus trituberculatus]|uniref:Uncharacterized protein n=1 Tax=Portunus trituberculatus TaxID=210409 RepID=A0A5B7HZX0_PORTR|nr:hypothetical protein [Portunus trituberculatus]
MQPPNARIHAHSSHPSTQSCSFLIIPPPLSPTPAVLPIRPHAGHRHATQQQVSPLTKASVWRPLLTLAPYTHSATSRSHPAHPQGEQVVVDTHTNLPLCVIPIHTSRSLHIVPCIGGGTPRGAGAVIQTDANAAH